jgi:hypothetical protein
MIAGGGILVKSHSILAFSAQKLGTDLISWVIFLEACFGAEIDQLSLLLKSELPNYCLLVA